MKTIYVCLAALAFVILVSGCVSQSLEYPAKLNTTSGITPQYSVPIASAPVAPAQIAEAGAVGLGDLCASKDACTEYCDSNIQQCVLYCFRNPDNALCDELFGAPSQPARQELTEIPRFVKHNFIELGRMKEISKFRSGYAHDFSRGTDEECRSMKHYFWVDGTDPRASHSPPWMDVKYFAPADGTIERVFSTQNQYGTEAQFIIASDEYPDISFAFFHVRLADGLKWGSKVKAGQHIGTVGEESAHGEIAVEISSPSLPGLVSFFETIDDSVFEQYKAKGATSREQFIITKEERDAKPLVCDYNTPDGRFTGAEGVSGGLETFRNWQSGTENWVGLG